MNDSRRRSASLQERVTAMEGELSPQTRHVARFLAQNPELAATATSIDLGERTGTSNATVVRTVKALGYEGLAELRKELMDLMTSRLNPGQVLSQQVQRLSTEGPVPHQVLASTIVTLQQAGQLIDETAWSKAVNILRRASAVFCYGVEQAGCIAMLMSIELTRYGKPSRAVSATGLGLAQELLTLKKTHAVVLVAPLRHFRELDAIIQRAHVVGCPVILMTEALGMSLRQSVDVVITTPQSTVSVTSEVAAPLVLAKALTLEIARRDRQRSVSTQNLLNQLRTDVVGSDVDVEPTFGVDSDVSRH